MNNRVALQLYSIREIAEKDYEAAVRKVAEIGYRAVETAGFPGSTPEKAKKLFDELGLTVCAAHVPLPLGENQSKVLETMEALGRPALICTQIRPDDVKTMDTVIDLCDRLNQGYEVAKSKGLSFGIHNHWWEFGRLDGRVIHDIMLDLLNPAIFLEVDTYWVKVGGSDPVELVKRLGKRAPFLHIKDGPAVRDASQTALGDGVMDIPGILAASNGNARWLVVELDRTTGDAMEVVRKSYDYLERLEKIR